MHSDDPRLQAARVDGQRLLIATDDALDALALDGAIDGVPLYTAEAAIRLFRRDLRLISSHAELSLAVFRPNPARARWLPCPLLRTERGWQRVFLEWLTCPTCGWRGATANPYMIDLYVGIPDRQAAYEAAARWPVRPCPRCGDALPRHPIWVEPGDAIAEG